MSQLFFLWSYQSYAVKRTPTLCYEFFSGIGRAYIANATFDIDVRCRYEITLNDVASSVNNGSILIDSLVLLPDVTTSAIYQLSGTHNMYMLS